MTNGKEKGGKEEGGKEEGGKEEGGKEKGGKVRDECETNGQEWEGETCARLVRDLYETCLLVLLLPLHATCVPLSDGTIALGFPRSRILRIGNGRVSEPRRIKCGVCVEKCGKRVGLRGI